MANIKALCVAHIELGADLCGGAQRVLYLLEELFNAEIHSVPICPEHPAMGKAAREAGIEFEATP